MNFVEDFLRSVEINTRFIHVTETSRKYRWKKCVNKAPSMDQWCLVTREELEAYFDRVGVRRKRTRERFETCHVNRRKNMFISIEQSKPLI